MTTVVMSVEGILTEGSTDTHALNYETSGPGRVLFNALRQGSRIILLSQDPSHDRVRAWLSRESLVKYADLHCRPYNSHLSPIDWKLQRLRDLLGVGYHVGMFVDSDPYVVHKALNMGITSLLFSTPSTFPGRQEKDVRYSPWYDLVEAIEHNSLIRATKSVEEDPDD